MSAWYHLSMPLINIHNEFGIMLVIPIFTILISSEVMKNFSPIEGLVLTTVQVNVVMIPSSIVFYMSDKLKQ